MMQLTQTICDRRTGRLIFEEIQQTFVINKNPEIKTPI